MTKFFEHVIYVGIGLCATSAVAFTVSAVIVHRTGN